MAENATESMKDYEKELERSFRTINEGDIVSGTVITVSEEDVTLDLNYYTQGIIKTENLSNDPDFNPKEQLQIGDVIEATVIKVDDGNGNIELSKKEANDVLAWDKLAEMMENETVVTVRIKESVPSGVVTFLEGIRAFIPASQLSTDYVEDTDKWIGKEVAVEVINVDKEKNKLVLSGKVVARKQQEEERKIMHGVLLAVLKNSLYEQCFRAIRAGKVSIKEKENIDSLYIQYHTLGGNHNGDILYKRVDELDIVPDEDYSKLTA